MKKLLFILLLPASAALAENYFPGLKVIMTPQEIQRAGLDKLTPDQLGVIDAAIIRHYVRTIENVALVRENQDTAAAANEKTWLSRFGLPELNSDWQELPSLKGRCTAWVGGNSFRLDNAQIWEGFEPITFELVGKDIEIQPRPSGQFALIVDGKNTTIRVHRVK